MKADDLLDKQGFGARDPLDCLPRHRLRQKSNEITWMPSFHGNADFAVRLESSDSRTMSGARIDHDERSPVGFNFDVFGRNDTHERVIDWFIQLAAVHDQFGCILQNMWRRLCDVFPVLVTTPTQDVHEQDTSLAGIHQILYSRRDKP